jgi:ketosteroid isomerase-like protein
MPATTPEQIHRLFEDAFNAGDIDGLMVLYEPDSVLVPQPGSVVQGSKQVRAALEGYLALRGRITLDTKLVLSTPAALAGTRSSMASAQEREISCRIRP